MTVYTQRTYRMGTVTLLDETGPPLTPENRAKIQAWWDAQLNKALLQTYVHDLPLIPPALANR